MENQTKDSTNALTMNKKKEGKITLGMLKGKPVTTSVPSISIRFHANAEQIEELYASDDEAATHDASTSVSNELDNSPLKYLPRLVKRSTSIDITPSTNIDASPPSDPWRFFSDIKGKITKSVEEKITEIKSRNHEEGSPLKTKIINNSKDNSSVSDSEDLSESSISKTCGIVSTTEGAEMSSDDDTPSIEKDKKTEDRAKFSRPSSSSGLRHRFKLLKSRTSPIEGTVSRRGLTSLYNINTDKIEQALPEENDIESAVDALEDTNLNLIEDNKSIVMQGLEQFDNIKVDSDNVINVREIRGNEVKQISWHSRSPKTVYSPTGFVDFRERRIRISNSFFFYSNFLAGILLGAGFTSAYFSIKFMLNSPIPLEEQPQVNYQEIVEVAAAMEIQPVLKHEGWVNELPEMYNPHNYHISQTQSVFLRLQANLLRISHSKSKVPKRALWNEPKIKPTFTHHRIYNLLGAKITLLPDGLAKKRHWSKKYPICITLNKDQLNFDVSNELHLKVEDEEATPTAKPKRSAFSFNKRKRGTILSQRFSKLSEENEDYDLDSENSRGSTPSPSSHEESEEVKQNLDDPQKFMDDALQDSLNKDDESECQGILEEDFDTIPENGFVITNTEDDGLESTSLYIFGRTDREKEDWYRRLTAATHKGATLEQLDRALDATNTIYDDVSRREQYEKYMLIFNKLGNSEQNVSPLDNKWINFLAGRVLFDCLRSEDFTEKVKETIQRKLSSIKLPYFIEDLQVTELSLGKTPPIIHKVETPVVDERGLWIDLDISYEGLVYLILQTKLNLMKLKHPHEAKKNIERPAMFHSDVEDSAESTSDDDSMNVFYPNPTVLDGTGYPSGTSGIPPSSNSKKFMKMVDKIAESKFFQAATEYRYIKKAMEGVSNTELRLKVDVKGLVGTLVLNIPPPPSDRVWIGFRPLPELALSAQPIVGDRNITFLRITSWIEKKLLQEFQKIMVIPNMEDLIIPVMSPDLPQ